MKISLYLFAIFFTILLLIVSTFDLRGQGYNFSSSVSSFTPLVGGTAVDAIESDDQLSGIIDLGFTFNYFGNNHTQIKASSNGFVTFNTSSTSSASFNGFGQGGTTLMVAPLWDDLDGTGGSASFQLTGSAPNRVFTIEWLNWKWSWTASNAGISFQIRLHEGSNEIELIYRQEAGDLNSPSASIGLVGSTTNTFYSLTSATQLASLSPVAVDNVSTKPTSGQAYIFQPNITPITAPLNQATAIEVNPIGSTTATVNWTSGNGVYRAVFVKQTTSVSENLTGILNNNTAYLPNTQFGAISSLVGSGWYCVYNGDGTSVAVSNLQSGFTYRVQVVEYNGLGGNQKYNLTTAPQNPANFTALLVAPGTPVSTLSIVNKTVNSVTLDISEGNGSGRVVFARATDTGASSPVDNTTYTANLTFGSGSQIGSSGWRCVFNGPSTTGFTVSNLSPATTYTFHVVDYNGPPGQEKFNIAPLTNNITQVETYNSTLVPAYIFTPSVGVFTPLVGGTQLNSIEGDDVLSSVIPIGFNFYHAGIAFNELKASSNGFITFNANAIFSDNTNNLFNNQILRPLIAPLWDDLDGSSGQASYATTGTAPNRVFTIEWLNWEWDWTSNANISFQLKLYETTNLIEFVYSDPGGVLNSPSASIGMAFVNTGAGNFVSLNNASAAPAVSTAVETANINTKPANGQVYSFNPQKINQTISFTPLSDRTYGSSAFQINASSNSGLPVNFSSSNPNVATVSENTVTITGVGSVTITASQAGNLAFNAAPDVNRAFIVNKADQVISNFNNQSYPFNTSPITLPALASSGLAVSYLSSNPLVATISGNTLTIVGVGETQITASQSGSSNYNAAPNVVRTYTITKGNQSITFTDNLNRQVTEETFQLTATSSSGLPISYTSSNPSVATVSGSTVTLLSAGTTNITASQAGNLNYNAANNVVRQLVVVKGNQTVTLQAIPPKAANDPSFEIFATASSGLPVTFTSSNTNVATISGSTVTIVGGGSTIISALQAGDNRYNAAPVTSTSSQTLVVSRISQTLSASPIPDKEPNAPPFTVEASASSGLPVSLQIYENIQSKISIGFNNTITILKSGSVSIIVNQLGNDTYFPAEPVELTFCIKPFVPSLTIATQTDEEILLRTFSPGITNAELLWFKDGEALTTTSIDELNVLEPGNYTVKASIEGCISDESNNIVIVYTGLEPNADFIEVFPNPAEDKVNIAIPVGKTASIVLTNSYGHELETRSSAGTHNLSLKSYASGVYFVKIKLDNRVIIKKIIKE